MSVDPRSQGTSGSTVSGGVSVVLLAHNQLEFTRRCIASLMGAEGLAQIVAVDNGSTDETPAFLSTLAMRPPPGVRVDVIRHRGNIGTSRSRNEGAALCRYPVIVFLDNDTRLCDGGALARLCRLLRARSEVGAVGPMLLYPPDGSFIQSAGGGTTSDGIIGLLGRGRPADTATFSLGRPVAWLPAACLACRRDVFTEIGGFDEALDPVAVCEDVELCLRLQSVGYIVWHEPAIRLLHFEGTTFNHCEFRAEKHAAFVRNMRYIRALWGGQMAVAPLSTAEEMPYLRVEKDYRDLDRPRVRVIPGAHGSYVDPEDGLWTGP